MPKPLEDRADAAEALHVSSLLRRLTQDREQKAAAALVALFFEELRGYAEGELGDDLLRRVGGSEVANAALKSALSHVRQHAGEAWTTERFRKLAWRIANHKVADAGRTHRGQKRDVARDVEFDEARPLPDLDAADPSNRAAAKELAVLCMTETLKAVVRPTLTEQRRLIAVLTVTGNYEANETHEILKGIFPDTGSARAPSIRFVELVAKEAREAFEAAVERYSAA